MSQGAGNILPNLRYRLSCWFRIFLTRNPILLQERKDFFHLRQMRLGKVNRSVRRQLDFIIFCRRSDVDIPKNYYIDDDPAKGPLLRWRSSATLMYTNWLNYYVYQETPFDINLIRSIRNEDLEPNRDVEKNG